MYTINEAFAELDRLYEDIENPDQIEYPPEIQKLIDQGAVVLADEPQFIKDELADAGITEAIDWTSEFGMQKHMGDAKVGGYHIATGMQNLWVLENNNGGDNGYQFTNLIRKLPNGEADWYKDRAIDLINAEVDGTNVRCFICQDTKKTNGAGSATKKYKDTGEAQRDLDSTFRICKYRKNPGTGIRYFNIPYYNMYYTNNDTGEAGPRPTEDFVFADHNIYETVYYTYSNYYTRLPNGTFNKETNMKILSYYLKPLYNIEQDIKSTEHVFNTGTEKSRTMSRYSNKVDVFKAAEESSAQTVCFVLRFSPYNNSIRLDLYNNPAKAQKAYADSSDAFLVGLCNGSSIQLLSGRESPANRTKAGTWIYDANHYDYNLTSERIQKVINRYNDLAQPGVLVDTLPKAELWEIKDLVAEGIENLEKDLVRRGKSPTALYLHPEVERPDGLLATTYLT